MAQILRVTPVIGLPQFNGWSHVWEVPLDPQTKCVVCLSVSGDNATNIGRDLIESITQLPPRSAQGLYQTIEDCVQLAKDQQGDLSVATGIFKNNRSIFATYNATVLLKRTQKVGRIIQSNEEPQLIEGKFETDDVFIFSTDTARQFLSQVELSFQRGFDSDGVITAIVPALHSLDDSSTAALAFISVVDEEPQPEPPPPAMEIDIGATESEDEPLISVMPDKVETTEPSEDLEAIPETEPLNEPIGAAANVVSDAQQKKKNVWLPKAIGMIKVLARSSGGALKKISKVGTQLPKVFSSNTYLDIPSRKKLIRWIVIIGVLLVVGFTAFLIIRSRMRQAEAEALSVAEPYRTQLAQIVSAAQTDPIPARENASVLIEQISSAQSEADAAGRTRTAEELSEVLTEAQTAYQEISGRDEVSELPLFYDLRLVTSDFIASHTTTVDTRAVFIDDEKKEAIVLDLTNKQVFKLDLSAIGVVESIASFGDNQVVILADGLYTLSLEADATPVSIKEEGDSNREATLTASFASYVYVFNPERRNIYRYVSEGDSYSDPVGWLLDPLGVPFDSVTAWAIDGDIWIGTDGGQILRFATGRVAEFSVTGLPESFSGAVSVVTREDLENLYVLESAKNRIVVLSKEGQFLRELKSSSLGAATGLLLDSSGNRAYAVSGSSVFELEV